MLFRIAMLICGFLTIAGFSFAATAPEPSWVTHLDIIIPAVIYGFKGFFMLTSGLFGIIGILLGHFYRQWRLKEKQRDGVLEGMADQLNSITHVLVACDGCKSAVNAVAKEKAILYGRRETDLKEAE